jgi:drug/metabolite transporter (DMT)-like permease
VSQRGGARAGLALIAAGWGGVAVIVRAVSLPAESIAFWRVVIAALAVLAGALILGRGRELVPAVGRARLVGLGLVLAVHWSLYFQAIKLSSVPLAVLLTYTGPMFIALLSPALTGERPTWLTWPALAAGTIGVAVVATDSSQALHASGKAIAAGLGAGFSFAILIILGRVVSRQVPAHTFVFWETATAAVVLAPVALLSGRVSPPDAGSLLGVLALGLVATAAGLILFARVLRHVDAPSAGVLMFLEPVFSVLLAWLVLSEQPSLRTLAGGLLVLAAGIAVVRSDAPAAPLEATSIVSSEGV